MNTIIKQDVDKNAFAVVTDIAKYCGVETKSVQNLIRNNIDDFIKCTKILENKILTALRKNKGEAISKGKTLNETEINIPTLELVTYDDGSDIIDWASVRLYQPHVELLLMLMKNTQQVKEHKINLIADFFATKFELAIMKQREQERLLKLLEKENKKLENKVHKLELDKFIDWDEEWISASRYVKEYKSDLSSSDLLDILADKNLVENRVVQRQIRIPIDGKSKYGNKGTLLFNKAEIDKLF